METDLHVKLRRLVKSRECLRGVGMLAVVVTVLLIRAEHTLLDGLEDQQAASAALHRMTMHLSSVAGRGREGHYARCDWQAAQSTNPLILVEHVDLRNCGLPALSSEVQWSMLERIKIIDLSHNRLQSLPAGFSDMPTLRQLYLGNNWFADPLPAVLRDFHSLQVLGLQNNRLREIEPFSLPPMLVQLLLGGNQLSDLNGPLAGMRTLRRLTANNNSLAAVPATIAAVESLEFLRLAHNRNLSAGMLPSEVMAMPMLSWLDLADCHPAPAMAEKVTSLVAQPSSTKAIEVGFPLDMRFEDANAVYFNGTAASLSATPTDDDSVVIKIYKAISADGNAESELRVHELLGEHPNIERPAGLLQLSAAEFQRITNLSVTRQHHARPGLVRGLWDGPATYAAASSELTALAATFYRSAGLRLLADPPTGAHPLRSKYPRRRRYSIEFVWRVARGVCHAMAHLHKHHIAHGQLYAHNVLVDGPASSIREPGHMHVHTLETGAQGPVVLSDLSAATWYGDKAATEQMEKLEVRAFGILLEELVARYDQRVSEFDQGEYRKLDVDYLQDLSEQCRLRIVDLRPRFASVCKQLDQGVGEASNAG